MRVGSHLTAQPRQGGPEPTRSRRFPNDRGPPLPHRLTAPAPQLRARPWSRVRGPRYGRAGLELSGASRRPRRSPLQQVSIAHPRLDPPASVAATSLLADTMAAAPTVL